MVVTNRSHSLTTASTGHSRSRPTPPRQGSIRRVDSPQRRRVLRPWEAWFHRRACGSTLLTKEKIASALRLRVRRQAGRGTVRGHVLDDPRPQGRNRGTSLVERTVSGLILGTGNTLWASCKTRTPYLRPFAIYIEKTRAPRLNWHTT
jgi:hypothetical protein